MPASSAYDYDEFQRDWDWGASTAPQFEPEYAPRPDINVVPGSRRESDTRTLSPAVHFVVRAAVVVAVIFFIFGIASISLNSAAISVGVEAQEYSNQLESARSSASDLEVTLASLSNPTRIRGEAVALGMGSSAETVAITLPSDLVVTDETGALSLSGSIEVLTAGSSTS